MEQTWTAAWWNAHATNFSISIHKVGCAYLRLIRAAWGIYTCLATAASDSARHVRALGPSLADLNGTVMQRADQSCKRA